MPAEGRSRPDNGLRRYAAIMQAMLVLVAVSGMVAAPPARGRMLLLPLDGASRDALARIAVNAGAALVDTGPFGRGLVVSGERSALMGAALRAHMLVLRATSGGCDNRTWQTLGQVQ
ncbi:MAG: hypothetical protein ABW048_04575 [Sphingobium sp.]